MELSYNLKRLLSFLYPITLESHESATSGLLEISLQNGKLVLDSTRANYSYGNLHQVFQQVIKRFNFSKEKGSALILGFGAGSIASILLKEKSLDLTIDGVELDPMVLNLYRKHFMTNKLKDIHLHQTDVISYLNTCQKQYDYIFIDVFQNLEVPKECLSESFVLLLRKVSHEKTQIAMNTMLKEDSQFIKTWMTVFGAQASFKHYDVSNLVLYVLPKG